MGIKKTYIILLLMLSTLLILTGCNKEEKQAVQKAKEDFRILYSYDEDKIRPVLEEEKTPEELAEEYLLTRLGLEEEEPKYKERGVLDGQGVFIESGIYEGGEIPNVTSMSKETIKRLQNNSEDRSLEKRIEEYERLKEKRQDFLKEQYKVDNSGKEVVEEEIKRQVTEFKQDAKNEVEQEKEDLDIEYEE